MNSIVTPLSPHPLNSHFAWTELNGPFRLVSEMQADLWNREGYFLLENAVSAAELAMLEAEIDPLEARTNEYLRGLPADHGFIARADELTFALHVVKRSQKVREFVSTDVLVDLCCDLLGDDVRLYWDQAVYKKAGCEEEFPWHQDNGYNFVSPQDYLTCWIALNDATIDNGCPWVMPGVHKEGTLEHWSTKLGFQCLRDSEGAIPVEAKAGDIVVFSSLTPHRTGPNLTAAERKAYIVQYAHAGAAMFPREGAQNVPQDDPERQFLVVSGGKKATSA